MIPSIDMSTVICVPIGQSAHQLAASLCQPHSDLNKAEQVYLNTLSVYAVNFYLAMLGFDTDWESSDSRSVVMRSLMDVADLWVKGYGKLECRRVLSDLTTVYVPEDVWSDRMGYVAVLLNEDLTEAHLLGFLDAVDQAELPLHEWRSLAEFPAYLSGLQHQMVAVEAPAQNSLVAAPVHLSHWLEGQIETLWQTVEKALSPQQVELAWRQHHPSDRLVMQRVKVLEFGFPPDHKSLALLIGITPVSQTTLAVDMQIRPTGQQQYLPTEVQVRLLDHTGAEVGEAKANVTETIQFQFEGHRGEHFSLEVTAYHQQVLETFII